MKSVLLGCLTAMSLGLTAANAQAASDAVTPAPAASPAVTAPAPAPVATPAMAAPAATPEMAASNGGFITTQQAGMLRAPKLVGVAVYDSENKDVGKIADLLLDHDGSVKAVVISIGGFLGIGAKDIAVPYSDIHWQTEQRTVATNTTAPGNATGGAMAPKNMPEQKTVSADKTEAYQGYPDRAVIDLSQAQLKSAPEFKYASTPEAVAPASPSTTDTTKPAPVKQ